MSTRPKLLKTFNTVRAAKKARTKKYKQGYRGRIGVLSKYGFVR